MRLRYLVVAACTVAAGLAVHLSSGGSAVVRDVVGDALWAAMMFWLVSVVRPAASTITRVAVAIGICFLVETSQLYHAPWIDAIRSRTLGHLLLGSGFDPRDLVAYTAGAVAAGLLDRMVRERGHMQGAAGYRNSH